MKNYLNNHERIRAQTMNKIQYEQICLHNGPPIDPDKRDNNQENARDIKIRETFISTYFPCVESKPSIQESCIYTVSRTHC